MIDWIKRKMTYEVFTIAPDEWQVRIGNEVLPIIWNSRGAALAGAQVEIRRRLKRQGASDGS